jgi:uncharacterized protein (TIGR00369 family)
MAADRPSPELLRMDAAAINRLLDGAFPLQSPDERGVVVEVEPRRLRAAMRADERHLRPGGLISGPTQMTLADVAAYALVLAHIGPVEMAVTNSLNIHFLRACRSRALTAEARLLRLGRRIVTVDVHILADEGLISQATIAYTQP